MAGTKEKPCALCKWDNFETYLAEGVAEGYDSCYLCNKASEWKEKQSNNSLKATSLPDAESEQGVDGRETP